MKVIVPDAGVTGITAAWHFSKAGHDVTVLERNAGAARETGFGNAGPIALSHATLKSTSRCAKCYARDTHSTH